MADYTLDVPVAAQAKSMSCWHASAQMIWWYWQKKTGKQGPMWTEVEKWTDDKGVAVTAKDFLSLAKKVGMKPLPSQVSYNSEDLANLLKRHGPLWSSGTWYGFGHVVVLTGVKGKTVHINDPDGGKKKTGTVSWFNEKKFNEFDGCLMYKDPDAY